MDLLLAAHRFLEPAAYIRRFAPEVWAPTEHRPPGTMRDAARLIGAAVPIENPMEGRPPCRPTLAAEPPLSENCFYLLRINLACKEFSRK